MADFSSEDFPRESNRPMILSLQPVQVATNSDDAESQLVFADGFLVAVLVRLSEQHGDDAGKWFLEAGFGPIDFLSPPPFADLGVARTWITRQLIAGP
ncbi:hypothetical protein ACRAWG_12515 [Methylobacterium sp. P31]